MRYLIMTLVLGIGVSNMSLATEQLSDGPGLFSGKGGEFSLFKHKKDKQDITEETLNNDKVTEHQSNTSECLNH